MNKYLLLLIALLFSGSAMAQCEANFFFEQQGTTATFYQTSQFFSDATWDFGDGTVTPNNDPVITHDYGAIGTYTVCLTVTDGAGCSDDTCVSVTVCGMVPDFTYSLSGNIAVLTNTSTGPYEMSIWDFGDGFTLLDTNAIHSFSAPGTYTVCLFIQDAGSCLNYYCEDIEIIGGAPCINLAQIDTSIACNDLFDPVCGCNNVTYVNPCEAYYYGGVTSYQLGACSGGGVCQAGFGASIDNMDVSFTNNSSGSFTAVSWDFGDGTQSTDENPVHTYAPGIYNVCLTITGPGCNNTFCTEIEIIGPPQCDAKFALEGTCDSVVLVSQSSGTFTQLVWNINGVVTYDSLSVPVVDTGDVTICLTVAGAGCQDTDCDSINIHEASVIAPDFTASFTAGPLPVTVVYSGTETSGFGEVFTWNPGDGTGPFTGQTVTHEYNQCNVYACLSVADVMGCSQTVCDSLYLCDVGINGLSSDNGFALYPNPGSSLCYLLPHQAVNGNVKLVITDVTGRIVEEHTLNGLHKNEAFAVNTSNYAQGCYFFNIVSQQNTASLRWIKE